MIRFVHINILPEKPTYVSLGTRTTDCQVKYFTPLERVAATGGAVEINKNW